MNAIKPELLFGNMQMDVAKKRRLLFGATCSLCLKPAWMQQAGLTYFFVDSFLLLCVLEVDKVLQGLPPLPLQHSRLQLRI